MVKGTCCKEAREKSVNNIRKDEIAVFSACFSSDALDYSEAEGRFQVPGPAKKPCFSVEN